MWVGVGAVYSFDPVGSFEREPFRAGGSGASLIQPFLDNQVTIAALIVRANRPFRLEERTLLETVLIWLLRMLSRSPKMPSPLLPNVTSTLVTMWKSGLSQRMAWIARNSIFARINLCQILICIQLTVYIPFVYGLLNSMNPFALLVGQRSKQGYSHDGWHL